MRAPRLAFCAAAVAAVSLAPTVGATGTVCNLVVDPQGDTQWWVTTGGTYVSPDQDILSADIAADEQHLTAVIRLASLRESDTDAPTGRSYRFSFRLDGATEYSLTATVGPDGSESIVWNDGTPSWGIAKAALVLDYANREVRMTAQAGVFGLSLGQTIDQISVITAHNYGFNGRQYVPTTPGSGEWVGGISAKSSPVDSATTALTYAVGTESCVNPAG